MFSILLFSIKKTQSVYNQYHGSNKLMILDDRQTYCSKTNATNKNHQKVILMLSFSEFDFRSNEKNCRAISFGFIKVLVI